MNGKEKCAILKQIRRDIVQKNDIAVTIADCKHQGNCKGTCPRCEAEVRAIEEALRARRAAGLKTVVAGLSAGILAAGLVACDPEDTADGDSLQGDLLPFYQSDVAMAGMEDTVDIPGDLPAFTENTDSNKRDKAETEIEIMGDIEVDPDLAGGSDSPEAIDTEGENSLPDAITEETKSSESKETSASYSFEETTLPYIPEETSLPSRPAETVEYDYAQETYVQISETAHSTEPAEPKESLALTAIDDRHA